MSLLCLVDREATSNAFSIKILSSDTVYDLKELIKTKKAPRFDDVAATELTLWRVSIPDDDDKIPILLNNVTTSDKKELHPMDDISDVFEVQLPKKTFHILFQRSQSGNADALRSY